jgi:protein-tyrosine phosphatase
MAYNFGPAAPKEEIIFGASMPGLMHSYPVPDEIVTEWMEGMQKHGIQRVCCLLPSKQLENFASNLLNQYADFFGVKNVCWAPIPDFHLSDPQTLENIILPFLQSSDLNSSPTVVHCAGGVGRTGHILAAWLVYGRSYTPLNALTSVTGTSATRNPYEAIHFGNATIEQLKILLDRAAKLASDSA